MKNALTFTDFLQGENETASNTTSFGNAISAALENAETSFSFDGKTYRVFEEDSQGLQTFLSENFALYPSYNNMIGSDVMRSIPITHQVNMTVYGRAYVIEVPVIPPVDVTELNK